MDPNVYVQKWAKQIWYAETPQIYQFTFACVEGSALSIYVRITKFFDPAETEYVSISVATGPHLKYRIKRAMRLLLKRYHIRRCLKRWTPRADVYTGRRSQAHRKTDIRATEDRLRQWC
jgi:hypothetical protein